MSWVERVSESVMLERCGDTSLLRAIILKGHSLSLWINLMRDVPEDEVIWVGQKQLLCEYGKSEESNLFSETLRVK